MREGTSRRSLGQLEPVGLGIGRTVGSGIFVVPGIVAGILGPASLIAWGFCCGVHDTRDGLPRIGSTGSRTPAASPAPVATAASLVFPHSKYLVAVIGIFATPPAMNADIVPASRVVHTLATGYRLRPPDRLTAQGTPGNALVPCCGTTIVMLFFSKEFGSLATLTVLAILVPSIFFCGLCLCDGWGWQREGCPGARGHPVGPHPPAVLRHRRDGMTRTVSWILTNPCGELPGPCHAGLFCGVPPSPAPPFFP